MEEDALSSASFVSSISASSIHQPRPPDGPKPSSQGFRTKRTGKLIRSPYLATSTPYPNKKTQHQGLNGTAFALHQEFDGTSDQPTIKFNARDKWAKAVKATGGVSTGWGNTMYLPHPSASVFLQSLMKAPSFSAVVTSKKRKRTQSASIGTRKSHAPSSTVGGDGKDVIALRDELVELKKSLNSVTRERDLIQARYSKLEQTLGRKDKEIEDLLASGHITSRDATRSLASSNTNSSKKKPSSGATGQTRAGSSSVTASGSGAVIASLRGKVHSLERALREKESELASLKREVSATSLKEMEIQCQVYFREINRLKQLIVDHVTPTVSDSPRSQREAQVKLKALNRATVKMAAQLEKSEAENERLKLQLEKFHSESTTGGESITHNEQGLRGSIADRYVDHKRSELLSAIVDLELRLQEKEGALESVCREMEQKKSHYETRIGELSGSHNDAINKIKLLESKLSEMGVSQEKLKNVIRKLKDDRTHYRTVAETTQSQLQDIQDRLEKEGMSKKDIIHELEVLKEKHQNEVIAREHARKLNNRRSHLAMTPEKERREAAAVSIQQQWRKRQAVQRQTKFHEATEQGVLDIQSALRGHLARKKMLSCQPPPSPSLNRPPIVNGGGSVVELGDGSESDSSDTSLAVERIQAALRGHAARQMALQDLNSVRSNHPRYENQEIKTRTQGDMDSPALTELWRSPASVVWPTGTNTPAPLGYTLMDSAQNPVTCSGGRNLKRERKTKTASTGHGPSPWLLHSHSDSSASDNDVISGHVIARREEAETESDLLHAPSPLPESSSGTNSESTGYVVNLETALLADELT